MTDESAAPLDDLPWQPVGSLGDDSSSSSEDAGPYAGYEEIGPEDVSAGNLAGEDEELWPVPAVPLGDRFLPRGTPTSVLAAPIADADAPLPPGGGLDAGFDFDRIDFAAVAKVASKIKLNALEPNKASTSKPKKKGLPQ